MATFRTLLNRTLVALGHADDQVDSGASSLTDNYHIKVALFLNDILEQVEDAAQWRVLRTRDTATINASALSATFASANERSRVFEVAEAAHGRLVPLVFDVTDTSQQKRLWPMDLAEILRRDQDNSNADGGASPTHFATSQTATGLDIYVWPRPSAAVNIEADLVIPQSRFNLDDSTVPHLDTNVKVPNLAPRLGATWWALEDRGEEMGPRGLKADQLYTDELAAAVALEHAAQGFDELVPS